MYLAKLRSGTTITYQIRQSYQQAEHSFSFRTVYDLSHDPRRFIKDFADHVVLFDAHLVQAVANHTEQDSEALLEELLVDFLPAELRRRRTIFQSRSTYRPQPLTDADRQSIAHQVHLFDRRRLYYLRYGAVDQSRLARLHEKTCRPLLGQSRDEREFYFIAEETALTPGHYLQYVYAIFNLQQYFHQSFAPWLPESLAFDEIAEHFEQELCRLHRDCRFWQSETPGLFLHPHLTRYLFMFFDYTPHQRSFMADFAKSFMGDHRTFHWPERQTARSAEKISELFTTSYEQLKKMTRTELSRLYRKKAMQLHPDQGGDHELFIELTAVYHELLQTK